jgi:adenine phosphoribosyltransferase
MKDVEAFQDCISLLTERVQQLNSPIDAIVSLDALGFIFGPLVAQKLNVPFVPIRKSGKLPGETVKYSYQLEYGTVCTLHPFHMNQ